MSTFVTIWLWIKIISLILLILALPAWIMEERRDRKKFDELRKR